MLNRREDAGAEAGGGRPMPALILCQVVLYTQHFVKLFRITLQSDQLSLLLL